jgi:integrase
MQTGGLVRYTNILIIIDTCKSIRRHVNYKVTTISQKNFYNLLKVVTPENGIKTLSTGERKNLYKDWLINAFWLGLFTGGRREAVINLKWSGIRVDEKKVPSYINVSDYKYNQSKSDVVSEDEKKVDSLVIYKEFYKYLIKLGYEKHKGSERYILAPETNMKRETMKDFISKAFTHFAQIIEPEEKLEFKHLRKTFATAAYNQFGDEANFITGHEGIGVMQKHYLNKKAIQKKARESFKIFDE